MGRRRKPALPPGQNLHPPVRTATPPRPTGSGATAAGPVSSLPERPSGSPSQAVPTYRSPHQGTLRLRGPARSAAGQQPRRTQPAPAGDQPEDQRGHQVTPGQRYQNDPGINLRHLASARLQHPHHLPPNAHYPSNLNSYISIPALTRTSGGCDFPQFEPLNAWRINQYGSLQTIQLVIVQLSSAQHQVYEYHLYEYHQKQDDEDYAQDDKQSGAVGARGVAGQGLVRPLEAGDGCGSCRRGGLRRWGWGCRGRRSGLRR